MIGPHPIDSPASQPRTLAERSADRSLRQLDEATRLSEGQPTNGKSPAGDPLKTAFRQFVGNTLFGQMLASLRETTSEPAYFHGGQGERIFQQQLDQVLVDEITEASAESVADPMYELFHGRRY